MMLLIMVKMMVVILFMFLNGWKICFPAIEDIDFDMSTVEGNQEPYMNVGVCNGSRSLRKNDAEWAVLCDGY